MRFTRLAIPDVWLIRPERRPDERGHFARAFCAVAFAEHGLPRVFPQCNLSFNTTKGTLRGLHWQDEPAPEGKAIRCIRGSVFDVAVDLRPGLPAYGRWVATILSADSGDALYIPPGFAHGFQTLEDMTELFYQMSESYRPGLARGLCWNDPTVAIDWPLANPVLSPRDAALPLLR